MKVILRSKVRIGEIKAKEFNAWEFEAKEFKITSDAGSLTPNSVKSRREVKIEEYIYRVKRKYLIDHTAK